jgi:membrane-associated phospholipid phosphatase
LTLPHGDDLKAGRRLRAEPSEWLVEASRMDHAVYRAVAETSTPELDRWMRSLSGAANYSRLWIGSAAVLALAGGPKGRRAAVQGLASVAVTSVVINVGVKQVWRRQRPTRRSDRAAARELRMPTSRSFPSGHSASAFAFATGVGSRLPLVALPLRAAAGLVAYSRVHTGVHYPGDVVVGSMLGTAFGQLTSRALDRYAGRREARAA